MVYCTRLAPFSPLPVSAAQKRPIAIVGEAISLPRWTWVGGFRAQAKGRDTKYHTSCFHIRKRCVVWYLRLVLLRNETNYIAPSGCRTPRHSHIVSIPQPTGFNCQPQRVFFFPAGFLLTAGKRKKARRITCSKFRRQELSAPTPVYCPETSTPNRGILRRLRLLRMTARSGPTRCGKRKGSGGASPSPTNAAGGGRRQSAFSAYRAIGGPMAKPAREWHGGKVESGPTRWESVSPFVKLTDNPTSTAGRGPFSAKRRRKRLRRKEYTIRVN